MEHVGQLTPVWVYSTGLEYCPSLWGGKIYIPANKNVGNSWTGFPDEDTEPASGEWWAGMMRGA